MNVLDKIKKFSFILAPLAGYTNSPFRLICRKYGASLVFTEMVSIYTITKKNLIKKNWQLFYFSKKEKPIALQLFGNNPDLFYEAAQIGEEMGYDIIDINMGCPVRKVIRTGAGANLLDNIELAEKIVKSVVKAVKIPVSIKIRTGPNEKKNVYLDFNKMAEDSGVKIIILHARTRAQGFSGNADWKHIKILKQKSKLFVIGNGDVKDRESALLMKKETGCDAVMIGRAAIGNPFIFKEIKNKRYHPSLKEKIKIALKHFNLYYDFAGERAIFEMRKHFGKYLSDFPYAAKVRKELFALNGCEEVKNYLKQLERNIY